MGFSFGAFKSIAIASAAPFIPQGVINIAGMLGVKGTWPGGPSSYDWNKIIVDLTIYDEDANEYWQVPVVPARVGVKEGGMQVDSVKILNLGPVEFFNGTDLDEISYPSFFPATYDAAYCSSPSIKKPMEYVGIYRAWKAKNTKLRLICPATEINLDVKLTGFEWELVGAEGDVEYTVTFRQSRKVVPRQIDTGGTIPPKGKKIPEERSKPVAAG